MKRFQLTVDANFEAEDLDDAFLLIAAHFLNLARGTIGDSSMFDVGSKLFLQPYETQPQANEASGQEPAARREE